MENLNFDKLCGLLARIPAIEQVIWSTELHNPWQVMFRIDLSHPIAWNIIQELGSILNYASYDEELKSVFKPVSLPPFKVGGPDGNLMWLIESNSTEWGPDICATWLTNKLPEPVDDPDAWLMA
ncbi:MAG TPA: hypothetical protein EYQ14_05865 [Gammaproteobacteria bacterium]|nr:hypothetical protein [Gammaproteobacteria bacterium]